MISRRAAVEPGLASEWLTTLPPRPLGRFFPGVRHEDETADPWGYFTIGAALMAVGYFAPYDDQLSPIYWLAIFAFGFSYVVQYGLIGNARQSFQGWLFFFLFFPKKEITVDQTALINSGVSEPFAFYGVVEIFLVVAMLLALATKSRKALDGRKDWLGGRGTYWAFLSLIIAGTINVLRLEQLTDQAPAINLFSMLQHVWPAIVAAIVWKTSASAIQTDKDVQKIFYRLFVCAVLLSFEYLGSKYLPFVPESVLYYEFDTIFGGFRSAWQSTDAGLLVGQLLIIGVAASFAVYRNQHALLATGWSCLFILVALQTFHRNSFVGAVVTFLFLAFVSFKSSRGLIVAGAVAVTSIVIVSPSTAERLVDVFGLENAKSDAYAFLQTDTVQLRLGNVLRGVEVFLHEPLLGCGPGNLPEFMGSPLVPNFFSVGLYNFEAQRAYDMVFEGLAKTNSHNLASDLAAEYGIFGIAALLLFAKDGMSLSRRVLAARRRDQRVPAPERSTGSGEAALGPLIGLVVYFSFQSIPLTFAAIALLVRLGRVAVPLTQGNTMVRVLTAQPSMRILPPRPLVS